ncbi:MAG: hypothetical protein ACJ76D_08740 [Solirubrobacterales bacterium]
MKPLRHPIRGIREPFGTAGLIIACVPPVLALTGAAFAAGKPTSKQKKEVEKIAKKFAGKPGAPGETGPAGANGNVRVQESKGDAEAGICSAAARECTLAKGATLTGPWGTSGVLGLKSGASKMTESEEDISLVQIAFQVPVSPAPTTVYEPLELLSEVDLGWTIEDGAVP